LLLQSGIMANRHRFQVFDIAFALFRLHQQIEQGLCFFC
jgi:hypothetical protein